jgi:heme/copper-type cytochrome/quinol oxidase subunit 2
MMALALLQTEQAAAAAEGLTPVSWVFMLMAMGAVIALTSWCFWRISRTREHFDPDGTGPAKPPVEGRVEREGGA